MTDESKTDRSIGKSMCEIPTTNKNKKLVEKRREQIVLAAIKLFSQKGYYRTTLKDLSEAAGISYGNIYGLDCFACTSYEMDLQERI